MLKNFCQKHFGWKLEKTLAKNERFWLKMKTDFGRNPKRFFWWKVVDFGGEKGKNLAKNRKKFGDSVFL